MENPAGFPWRVGTAQLLLDRLPHPATVRPVVWSVQPVAATNQPLQENHRLLPAVLALLLGTALPR